MQKKVLGRKFSRGRKGRTALFRSLVRAVVVSGKITTTKAKAKAVQKILENSVTQAKKKSITGRRKLLRELGNDRQTVETLFNKIAPLFEKRSGGYTKITYLPRRLGDRAEMAVIEFVEKVKEEEKKTKAKKETKKEVKVEKEKK